MTDDAADPMVVHELQLQRSSWVPNNSKLAVLLYRGALSAAAGSKSFEDLFASNGWTGIWRNGIFTYDHYHSGAHEVLGIAGGTAKLLLGGPEGKEIDVAAGDCLILPAGTGHRNLGASADFSVVGGYPPGQHADILTSAPSEEQLLTIAELSIPSSDPIEGADGYLVRAWHSD
ncbi:uncharacterized protein containing double-stranded beta helix domain [Rhizobium leguminosarum bv. viciae WSM1455]|nr:uncharacterized protein containing double-stranded beta helix domain [Rhizobium leguminosarum bv. viciae WSM1455]